MSIDMRICSFALFLVAIGSAMAQAPEGRRSFQNRCGVCHGTDGNGGEHAPSILAPVQSRNDQELIALLREGVPLRGMPAFNDVPEPELRALVGFLRTLAPPARGAWRPRDGHAHEGPTPGRQVARRSGHRQHRLAKSSCAPTISAFTF